MATFQYRFYGIFFILFLMAACSKPGVNTEEQIKQADFVYEDNVNGRVPPPDNIIESTQFYYNSDGTLNRATVYDDTTLTAHLLKELNITYLSDKVIIQTYLDTIGNVTYTAAFNAKKQITSLTLADSSGLYISYFNDRISSIRTLPSGDEYLSFIYDNNDNLLQYDLNIGGFLVGRAILEYDNELIHNDFDSRFFTKDIKFIYLGGLDLITKLGLNYGKSTQNKLVKRTEINLLSSSVTETYRYNYTQNSKGDINRRNVQFSSDTLYYRFKY